MTLSTNHLLKPQDRVFTRKRKRYGAPSIVAAVLSVAVLVPVYASFVGLLVSSGWVMLLAASVGVLVIPWLLARILRVGGPRLFAATNVAMALLFLVVLGGPTDRALESKGILPFVAVAQIVGSYEDGRHVVTSAGEVFVDVLRKLTVSGGVEEERRPAVETVDAEAGEPRVDGQVMDDDTRAATSHMAAIFRGKALLGDSLAVLP